MSVVHDQVFGARTPNYKVLQQLDRKVRDFYTPPSLQVPGFGGPMADVDSVPVFLTLQRYIGFAIREMSESDLHQSKGTRSRPTALFYMHRGFFARAIEDSPDDPLGSKYAPSVLAVYNGACSFVGLVRSLFSQQPALTERMWFLFTHVFSCAVRKPRRHSFRLLICPFRSFWALYRSSALEWHWLVLPCHIWILPYGSSRTWPIIPEPSKF